MTDSTAVLAADFPYAGDTSYTLPGYDPLPINITINVPNIPIGMTDQHPWLRRINPREGVEELLWLESRPPELAAYQGRWVVVMGQHIVADGANMSELRTLMAEGSIMGGLVAHVPEDIGQTEYLIG
ncbi:MAG: hypothetical protein IIC91_00340 [Chloroflexi bacterium]|nr:hypothetical protein [Chloroflexota bacterium]